MDPELELIFTFVFSMVLLVFVMAQLFHRRAVRHEERKLKIKAQIAQARAEEARYANGTSGNMEERVRVLERIATDSNHALASQIEELRQLDAAEEKAS